MENLTKLLHQIWCSWIESDVFIACLKYWPIWTTKISRTINLNRTTTYGHIQKLFEKWLIKSTMWSQWKKFYALTSEELIAHLASRKEYYENLTKYAKTIKSDIDLAQDIIDDQKVSYYEWDEVFDKISQRVMNTEIWYYYTNIDEILKLKWRWIKKLIQEFKKNTATIKEFIFESEFQEEYIQWLSSTSHQIKVLPIGENHNYTSDIWLTDWYYYHIAYWEKVNAIEINNRSFYNTQTAIFEQLWDLL